MARCERVRVRDWRGGVESGRVCLCVAWSVAVTHTHTLWHASTADDDGRRGEPVQPRLAREPRPPRPPHTTLRVSWYGLETTLLLTHGLPIKAPLVLPSLVSSTPCLDCCLSSSPHAHALEEQSIPPHCPRATLYLPQPHSTPSPILPYLYRTPALSRINPDRAHFSLSHDPLGSYEDLCPCFGRDRSISRGNEEEDGDFFWLAMDGGAKA